MSPRRPPAYALMALALLVLIAATLIFFGGPQPPAEPFGQEAATVPPSNDESGGVSGAPVSAPPGTSGDSLADAQSNSGAADSGPMPWEGSGGTPPEGGTPMPLIPIPGCRCHSDDPAVVEEHSRYTLADCAECH